MSGASRVITPEICAKVREWDERRKSMPTLAEALNQCRQERRNQRSVKRLASELKVPPSAIHYIVSQGGTLKSHRNRK
jgi:hypothetical protein